MIKKINITIILASLILLTFDAIAELNVCQYSSITNDNIINICGGYESKKSDECKNYLEKFISTELNTIKNHKHNITRDQHKSLLCEYDSEIDDTNILVNKTISYDLLNEKDWLEKAKNSKNEFLRYAVLTALILRSNDKALSVFINWIKDDYGRIPEDLQNIMGLMGTDLAVDELIKTINKFGYPYYRFGVQQLSYENKHPIWNDFLCEYYPKVRSPMRLLFGVGAPDDFTISERFDELRKVRLDVEELDACDFWY